MLFLCVWQADSEGDKAMGYSQVFVLKTDGSSWFIQHDIFRLALHDFAAHWQW